MKKIVIGLLGFGTVGSGTAAILENNRYDISTRTNADITIKKALVHDIHKPRPDCRGIILTDDPREITDDPEIDIVVEVMGGIEPARTLILTAMANGKNVVTANKDLLAQNGEELLEAAKKNGRDLYFEASVAGGIPIIAALRQSLTANRISSLLGIINGTTNYILSAMTEQGRNFADVLKEAQELGYAEADPVSDVEGLDAARKLAILSSLAFNTRVTFNDVYAEGISNVSPEDIHYADELGCVIKLLAIAKNQEEGIEVRVHPALISKKHPLANISGVYNAIYVTGDAVGETMFYGKGAGALPTGSSVVADIIQIVRNMSAGSEGLLNCGCYRNYPIISTDDFTTAYYIRLKVKDEPKVFATLALFFAEAGISFHSIIQKPRPDKSAEIALVTHPCREGQLRQAIQSLNSYSKLDKIYNVIRLETNGISI
ncbi:MULTISPECIES: homoserine dehydrogenase [Dehalobacter]|jgi:homoserine dehydrogenase|uniref:Homoserine dehydrogenase n=2 Tax=Dehalobacter restrictus TaxID=55583 RepID=A0A857DK76_9FIRM|nr:MULTISPECIES: homoserine dehydrogenase [Dehalobacter]AHF10195.1 homoserine dehydrogenase [Dehalobacter restrictus DSM 9455]MCG1024225.1 homoserine dehydrogenase [Dehalobacter sp.]MDJ0307172.1 homoserine dehydrogenase [Dehalobacter sp.]OCZ50456.1 homoserine dehydrogenase [Dehalobacter sp. TeCB1]QHA00785.1 homoserine dehydrogenase [Dehalobacter restrictus]